MKFLLPAVVAQVIMLGPLLSGCNQTANEVSSDSLAATTMHDAKNGLKGLVAFEGLGVHTFATEPMLKNPTNIDVDERGRVWVTEAYNYRPDINGNPVNAQGDRIMILEDTDGDAIADTAKVFYQGPEINAPLGICILGNRVIVSQSPYIWSFYDDNGDDKADRKEILFQGIQGEQHDHGAHAFTFGPDGKLYFNFGNEAKTIKDKNGNPVKDQDGDVIGPEKYRDGMVLRCNLDGSNVEVLAQNFRNPFEVAVDSYGTMWQSDNDDDGNRGVRINYVMQHGNYGFKDEVSRASWQEPRTNMEDSIPLKHWHLNDPGVVPNLLQTFAGSPTGMAIYEGALLPKEFQGQIIHSDAGPNVVRSYPVENDGAGYSAKIINILKGEHDQWFRPADVCVAPDGSLMIADWYDPGVGGHQAGDQIKGRIYRVAPPNARYVIPHYNLSNLSEALEALQNPNLSVRYQAFTSLQKMGASAVPALVKMWNTANDPRMKARAFWVLVKMPLVNNRKFIQQAISQSDPNLKIAGIRAAVQLGQNVTAVVSRLVNDPDIQVRRECALALHHSKSPDAPALWAKLASQHNGDRWYLEALGIGAADQWNTFFKAYTNLVGDPLATSAGKDIVWRARTDLAVPYLAKLATNPSEPLQNRLRYFRAFDFNAGPAKSPLLLGMIENNKSGDTALNKLALHHLDINTVKRSAAAQKALYELLERNRGTHEFIELVRRYELKNQNNQLLQMAVQQSSSPQGRDAAGLLLKYNGEKLIYSVLARQDSAKYHGLLVSLGRVGAKESIDLLQQVMLSERYPMELRLFAASKLGKSGGGEDRVLELLRQKKVPQELIPNVVASVQGAWRKAVSQEANTYLAGSGKAVQKPVPTLASLRSLSANPQNGKAVFADNCAVCHKVGSEGFDFGPKLTEIGSKYPPEGLLHAIVYPSDGIGFGYETWEINLKDGSKMTGVLASKNETDVDLKLPGGASQHIKTTDIKSMKELKMSMMPEGLYENMTSQNLADLLAYLSSQKKK